MERSTNNSMNSYPQKIYSSQLITLQDLEEFKKQLLKELLQALSGYVTTPPKKWLKSHEVRRMLKISPGTLQTLKNNGTIPFSRVGGIHFYEYNEIQKLLTNMFKSGT